MRYAIVVAGSVVNIVEAESALEDNWFASETANIGDNLVGDSVIQVPQEGATDIFKQRRAESVSRITVTTKAGNVFDGDEVSQGRMARAIISLQASPDVKTTSWILHDNQVANVDAEELSEALALAGVEQTKIWVGVN